MHPQAIASNNVIVSLAAAPDKLPCGRARDACGGDRRVQLPATLKEPWLIGLRFFFVHGELRSCVPLNRGGTRHYHQYTRSKRSPEHVGLKPRALRFATPTPNCPTPRFLIQDRQSKYGD